jgi:hypothetical protein
MHLFQRACRHRLLVVIDETCPSQSPCDTWRLHAERERTEALVIAPVHGSTATQWYVDGVAARADATKRLRCCVACLASRGIRVTGRLVEPDPVHAIADALRDFRADRILLVTASHHPSIWLQPNVIDRVRRGFQQPVEHMLIGSNALVERTP